MAFNKARALQEAERTLAQGKVAEAVQQYLAIIANDPSDLALINLTGDLCVRARKISEAMQLFRRLAESYVYQGYVPRGIAIYKKILKLEPSNVDAMLKLAGLYSGQGLAREARDLYAQALQICQDQKLQEKALEVMRRISVDEPANVAHRLRLADLYRAAGKAEDAFNAYLEASDVALAQSDHEVAALALEQAAALRPDDPRLRDARRRLSPLPDSVDHSAPEEPAAGEEPPESPAISDKEPGREQLAEPVIPEEGTEGIPTEETEPSPEPKGGPPPSEFDLSEDWAVVAAGQSAPAATVLDFDDLDLEIDFYLTYDMPQKAVERLTEVEAQFPGDPRLRELRRRLEERRAHKSGRLKEPWESRAPTESQQRGPGHDSGWADTSRGKGVEAAGLKARQQPDFESSLGVLVNELGSEASRISSEDDPQTHYELGIAFREMGLVDEAIAELQKAVRGSRPAADRNRYLSACKLLALSFVDKRMPVLAAKWYTRALEVPGLDPDAILALQYDLGIAYELAGNLQAAREHFLEVYGQNIEYRDVAAKIRHLSSDR